jgi:hypothetical protein
VHLFAKVNIGAAGAPTLVTSNQSKGFASITRTGDGAYDVVLQDSYYKFLGCSVVFDAGSAGPAAPTVAIYDNLVTDNPGTFSLLCQNGGVDTDPASGEIMYIHLIVGNSSAI